MYLNLFLFFFNLKISQPILYLYKESEINKIILKVYIASSCKLSTSKFLYMSKDSPWVNILLNIQRFFELYLF